MKSPVEIRTSRLTEQEIRTVKTPRKISENIPGDPGVLAVQRFIASMPMLID
jgi:hypothetical protein